jgi:hypothetical protein
MPTLILKVLRGQVLPVPSHYSSGLQVFHDWCTIIFLSRTVSYSCEQELIKVLLSKNASKRPSCSLILKLPLIKKHLQQQQIHLPNAQSPQAVPIPQPSLPAGVVGNPVTTAATGSKNKKEAIELELKREEENKNRWEQKLKLIQQNNNMPPSQQLVKKQPQQQQRRASGGNFGIQQQMQQHQRKMTRYVVCLPRTPYYDFD